MRAVQPCGTLAAYRRAVLPAAVYSTVPRRGTERGRQAAIQRGEL